MTDEQTEVEPWQPAFEGQRPPFTPGHELSLKHGAFSLRKVGPVVDVLVAELLEDPGATHLRASIWRPAVLAWARAEARVLLMTSWLEDADGIGVTDEGDVLPVVRALKDWESRAEKHRRELGLTPLAAARLGRDRTASALDTAQLMARLEKQEQERDERDGAGDG